MHLDAHPWLGGYLSRLTTTVLETPDQPARLPWELVVRYARTICDGIARARFFGTGGWLFYSHLVRPDRGADSATVGS